MFNTLDHLAHRVQAWWQLLDGVLRRMFKSAILMHMNTEREVQELDATPKYSEQERLRLARQVQAAREVRGITQSELAEMADVGRGTIVNIENGKTIPQSSVIWKLMGALDMRPHVQPKLTPEVEGWLNLIAQTISDVDPVKRESIMVEALTLIATRARS